MATITTKKDKAGNVTGYKVTLCVGRDEANKQIWRTCTLKMPEGLTPAKERKEVERQADAWAEAEKVQNVNIPTAINNAATYRTSFNSSIYNLSGQRVDVSYKGILIKNGKKVYNK